MTLEEAKQYVQKWLWDCPERTTVNREWDNQYITDAALMWVAMVTRLEDKLNAYEEALQREKDPKWEAYIAELADGLIGYTKVVEAYIASSPTWEANKTMIEDAARQLTYMATSFTNKANFVPMRNDLEAVKKVCVFSNGELRYVKNPGSGLYWCHTHNRAAEWIRLPLGIEEPSHVCNPNLGGITMPCRVAKKL